MSTAEPQSDFRQLLGYSFIVYGGKLLRAALGLGVSLIVARWLGPQDFGLFWLFIETIVIGENLLGEGFHPSVVRHYASYAPNNPAQADQVLSSTLALHFVIGIPGVLIGWVGSDWIAYTFFHSEMYVLPLRLGCLGALGAALWSFSLAAFQAREDFRTYSLITPLVNILRVAALPILAGTGHLTLTAVLSLHVVFLYLCPLISLWWLRSHLGGFRVNRSLLHEVLRFGKWTALTDFCLLLPAHLGVPFISYFSDAQTAGIYAAGASLLLLGDYLTATILTIQLPRVSKLTELAAYRTYIRHSLLLSTVLTLALSPTIFLVAPLIHFFYGPEYTAAIPVVQVLFVSFLATVMTYPLFLIFYAMNRPYLVTFLACTALASWLIVGILLIPDMGAVGAAWATLTARGLQAILIVGLLWGVLGYQQCSEGQA